MADHSFTRPAGYDTDEELQAHLAQLEAQAVAEGDEAPTRSRRTFEDVQSDISTVRHEIEQLRARLYVISAQAEVVVKSRAEWADASAHAQLGDYPWLKLAGAMTGTFLVARLIKGLPLGPLVTAALPLVAGTIKRKIER
ncbi:hypothetical protein RGCCGE502_21515 [Rhizobium grahamii CCGE 502]|uniref:Uncharacterized protein n=2 Tax=Rhizobium grahamii TaxID=1120045 RepID=S3HC65_9HYPH|nr:hypothetical protein RGCCGE502_21515 [Rhizobium grahamii CCGE 502]